MRSVVLISWLIFHKKKVFVVVVAVLLVSSSNTFTPTLIKYFINVIKSGLV